MGGHKVCCATTPVLLRPKKKGVNFSLSETPAEKKVKLGSLNSLNQGNWPPVSKFKTVVLPHPRKKEPKKGGGYPGPEKGAPKLKVIPPQPTGANPGNTKGLDLGWTKEVNSLEIARFTFGKK